MWEVERKKILGVKGFTEPEESEFSVAKRDDNARLPFWHG